jgi:hypothetical protein
MGRKTVDHGHEVVARGCLRALQLAGDERRLVTASAEQLNSAATFLARALARFDEEPAPHFRVADSIQRLEAAGGRSEPS